MKLEMTTLTGLPGALRFNIESKHVGDAFAITVIEPYCFATREEAPGDDSEAFRVLYMMDSDFYLPAAYSLMCAPPRVQTWDLDKPIEPIMVVAIGYDRGPDYAFYARSRDLTPPGFPITEEVRSGPGADAAHGNADAFLRFIGEELHPIILEYFPVVDEPAGLFGFSYGGLFASYAMFERSPLFDRFIIGSPANAFPDELLLGLEQRCWERGHTLAARAYLTVSSHERTSAHPGFRYLAENYDKLAARLQSRGYEGFTLATHEYEGESHISSAVPCLHDGIDLLYAVPSLPTSEGYTAVDWYWDKKLGSRDAGEKRR